MAKCNPWKKSVRKSGQKRRNKISSRELSNQPDKFLTPLKLFQYIIRASVAKVFFPPICDRRPQIKIGMTERGAEKSQLSSRACHIPPNNKWVMVENVERTYSTDCSFQSNEIRDSEGLVARGLHPDEWGWPRARG